MDTKMMFATCARMTATLLLTVAGVAQAAASTTWTVVELTPDSAGGGIARAVNNRGDVVGQTFTGSSFPFGLTSHAFLWQNGARQDIGSAVGTNSIAWRINDGGTIVGQVDGHAYMWKDGQATSLNVAGSAVSLNNRGEMVGTYWTGGAVGSGQERPFLMRDGVLFELPVLGSVSAVNDINEDGIAVGWSTAPSTANEHAVFWRDLAIADLGTLGGLESFGNRINNDGVVVGTAQDASGVRFMVRWNVSGGPAEKLVANFVPAGINNRGAIVGSDVSTGRPFLHEDGTVTDLLELPAMTAGGWQAFSPMGINDRGWIVGSAWKPGVAFVGTALLLIPH